MGWVPQPDKPAAETETLVVSILETRPLSVKDGAELLCFFPNTKTTEHT